MGCEGGVEGLILRPGKTIEDVYAAIALLRPFGLYYSPRDSRHDSVYEWEPAKDAGLLLVSEWTTEGYGRPSFYDEGQALARAVTQRMARPDRFGLGADPTWEEILVEWATREPWAQCAKCTAGSSDLHWRGDYCNMIVELLAQEAHVPCVVERLDELTQAAPRGTLSAWWRAMEALVWTDPAPIGCVRDWIPAREFRLFRKETWT